MAKRGRPRKNPAEKIAAFGMTEAEYQALANLAEERNRSVSQVVRAMGTAVVHNPDLVDQWLSDLDARGSAGVAIPPSITDSN